jgi:hypothetical protein
VEFFDPGLGGMKRLTDSSQKGDRLLLFFTCVFTCPLLRSVAIHSSDGLLVCLIDGIQ